MKQNRSQAAEERRLERSQPEKEERGPVQTVAEMFAQYPDEWIFFEVVEEDEYERPTKGILLAHHTADDFQRTYLTADGGSPFGRIAGYFCNVHAVVRP